MGTHSKLSPSSAHRWVLCPGSIREETKYPEQGSGAAAIDGTHSHTLLEHCLNNAMMEPHGMIGKELTDHEGSFIVDTERALRVAVAVNYVKDRRANTKSIAIRAEEKVDPALWYGRNDMDGTADIQMVEDNLIEVVDYKDGMSPVSPVENLQMAQYGLGSLVPYYEEGKPLPFTSIRLTIIQPKLESMGMPMITHWEITVDELFAIKEKIALAATQSDLPDAPLVPGESQCKWCDAKGSCNALAGKALGDAQVLFGKVDLATQSANQNPDALDDTKVCEIIEAAPLIRQFLEAVDKEALRRFETGHAVAGLKVVRGRGSRVWNLTEEEIASKLKSMGIPKAAIFPAKLVTPAAAKKLSWDSKGEQKSLSKKQIKRVEDNYITKLSGKLSIALASDSRAEVPMDATTIFKEVGAPETVETVETEKPSLPDWMS